jgi:hypothetical protein
MTGLVFELFNFIISFFGSFLAFIAWHHFDMEGFWSNKRTKREENRRKSLENDHF